MWNERKRFLDSQLSPGESLLWSGHREPAFSFDLPMPMLFLLACSHWALPFCNVGVWNSDFPPLFRYFGIIPLIYGVYFLVGRFFVDAWQRSKTYYGVTNHRVIIVFGIFSPTVQSLNLGTMSEISLSERPDLSGTITFGPTDDVSDWKSRLPFKTTMQEPPVYPILDSIQNAKHVYEIIRNAQRA